MTAIMTPLSAPDPGLSRKGPSFDTYSTSQRPLRHLPRKIKEVAPVFIDRKRAVDFLRIKFQLDDIKVNSEKSLEPQTSSQEASGVLQPHPTKVPSPRLPIIANPSVSASTSSSPLLVQSTTEQQHKAGRDPVAIKKSKSEALLRPLLHNEPDTPSVLYSNENEQPSTTAIKRTKKLLSPLDPKGLLTSKQNPSQVDKTSNLIKFQKYKLYGIDYCNQIRLDSIFSKNPIVNPKNNPSPREEQGNTSNIIQQTTRIQSLDKQQRDSQLAARQEIEKLQQQANYIRYNTLRDEYEAVDDTSARMQEIQQAKFVTPNSTALTLSSPRAILRAQYSSRYHARTRSMDLLGSIKASQDQNTLLSTGNLSGKDVTSKYQSTRHRKPISKTQSMKKIKLPALSNAKSMRNATLGTLRSLSSTKTIDASLKTDRDQVFLLNEEIDSIKKDKTLSRKVRRGQRRVNSDLKKLDRAVDRANKIAHVDLSVL